VSSTILIADDNTQTRGTVGDWLEHAGYDCVSARTGDALAAMQDQATEAAVVGVGHAGDGGMWIIRRLRALPDPVGIVVVATPPSFEVATAANRLGVIDCLPGPAEPADLIDAVRRALLWRNAVLTVHEEDRSLQDAVALEQARLVDAARRANPSTIDTTLLAALRDRAPEILAHVQRVAGMATDMATALGLPAAEIERTRIAALLHDIGRIALPERLLTGAGPLADHEIAALRMHVGIARDMLASAPGMHEVAWIVGTACERLDGSGYPNGLIGQAIPLASRIIAVADTYDALVSTRPGHDGMSHDMANAELARLSGTSFDPDVVRTWIGLERAHR
jgi:response regulator RpfG family c-di-GMP phosphodiesterase